MINQEYLPCNRQIHIKISDEELKLIRERMEQLGFKNMSAYIRKMAIDGYCINVDFSAIHELVKMMCVDSRNINQIAKAATKVTMKRLSGYHRLSKDYRRQYKNSDAA